MLSAKTGPYEEHWLGDGSGARLKFGQGETLCQSAWETSGN